MAALVGERSRGHDALRKPRMVFLRALIRNLMGSVHDGPAEDGEGWGDDNVVTVHGGTVVSAPDAQCGDTSSQSCPPLFFISRPRRRT